MMGLSCSTMREPLRSKDRATWSRQHPKPRRKSVHLLNPDFRPAGNRQASLLSSTPSGLSHSCVRQVQQKGRSGKSWKKGKAHSQTPEARLRQPQPRRERARALTSSQSNRFVRKPSHPTLGGLQSPPLQPSREAARCPAGRRS